MCQCVSSKVTVVIFTETCAMTDDGKSFREVFAGERKNFTKFSGGTMPRDVDVENASQITR